MAAGHARVVGRLAKKTTRANHARKIMKGATRKIAIRTKHAPAGLSVPHPPKHPKLFIQAVLMGNAGVRSFLIDIAGENAINILRDFKAPMSDEDLAKKTKMKVSDVRVVLNRLHSYGITEYSRSRDKDSGWYSYVWSVSEEKSKEVLGPVAGLGTQEKTVVAEEGGDHYYCKVCGPTRQFPFDVALNLAFRCDACGNSLEFSEKIGVGHKPDV
jgi:transcription initiation factor TFIIE subunit alpha